jgi:hypothetical protein
MDLEDLDRAVRDLAVAYLGSTPGPMLRRGVEVRGEALRRLRDQRYRPNELADLYLILGRVQGVLAYAALDLGDADVAMTHADAAWACADRARDNELRVWVRGTQSLVARFRSDHRSAMWFVTDGLRYPTRGTGRMRLLCGYAQCHANLGDSRGVNRVLDRVGNERDRMNEDDAMPGLFTFSLAKQHYYAGSSLIWLDGGADAERAARESRMAIDIWEREPVERRSLDDEALARVYQATACLQLGRLDAAADAVRPVLDLPADRRISWIHKRLDRFDTFLRDRPFRGSPEATALRDVVRSLSV